MNVEIKMPSLGYDMETGKIARWLKAPGDLVERGEPIAEIETDKTTVEMESIVAGRVVELICAEGGEAVVGATIAVIEEAS